MMGKHALVEDEIPLTHYSSPTRSITQETKTRFDNLLRSALNQEKGKLGKKKRGRNADNREPTEVPPEQQNTSTVAFISEKPKKSFRKNLLTETQEIDFPSTSDDDVVTQANPNNNSNKLEGRIKLAALGTRQKLEALRTKNKATGEVAEAAKKPHLKSHTVQYIDSSSEDENNAEPRRRLSYTIHKADSPRNVTSPAREVSPLRPIPVPRKRREKKHSTAANTPEKAVTQESAESSQDALEDNREPAPPLYSTMTASYENLEKDGGPIPTVRRKVKQKTEDNEMQNMKASYEELTPSRQASKRLPQQSTELSYEEIVGIYVHRSDPLKDDALVRHPLVKVYITDAATGEYLKKSDPSRSVAYYNESDLDYISPLMTQEYDFKARRSQLPSWEELIVFNEDFSCILNSDSPVIILFEILDFASFSVASSQYKKLSPDGGWHRIAWAFLKPLGTNGHKNVGHQCRLQLYKPSTAQRKTGCDSCEVYAWWRQGSWQKYPSTLYVTVKPIQPPDNLPPVLRSRLAMQGELGTNNQHSVESKTDSHGDIVLPSLVGGTVPTNPVTWSRLPTQTCKVPNKRALTLSTTSRGCFVLKFSCSGLYLACATVSKDEYTILVYTIPDGKECAQLTGHQGLVYDLHWSPDDTLLLSASADCTACVWTIASERKSQLIQMLPHPAYVYSARFSPVNVATLYTACSDHAIRIWSKASRSSLFELREELEEHAGFVTALCFEKDGTLVSGDSVGRILVWRSRKHNAAISHRELKVREIQHVVINSLSMHPGGQRLLVHTRDSLLRMVDLTTASVIQWFHGGLNYRVQTYSAMSPCGGLVFAATEDGTVCVWNSDTGVQAAIYAGLEFPHAASGVDYHPYEHMTAFCSATSPCGVLICSYDKTADGSSLGLQMLDKTIDRNLGETSLEPPSKVVTKSSDEANVSALSKHVDSFMSSTLVSSTPLKSSDVEKDMKLKHIIERMDKVLLATTPSKSTPVASDVGGGDVPRNDSARDRRRRRKESA